MLGFLAVQSIFKAIQITKKENAARQAKAVSPDSQTDKDQMDDSSRQPVVKIGERNEVELSELNIPASVGSESSTSRQGLSSVTPGADGKEQEYKDAEVVLQDIPSEIKEGGEEDEHRPDMKIKFEKSSDSSEDGVEYYDGELRMKITAKMDVKEV